MLYLLVGGVIWLMTLLIYFTFRTEDKPLKEKFKKLEEKQTETVYELIKIKKELDELNKKVKPRNKIEIK